MNQVPYGFVAIGYWCAAILLGLTRHRDDLASHFIGQALFFFFLYGIIWLFNFWLRKRHDKQLENIRKKNEEAIGWKGWGK